ncbi:MAG: AMP-binding protein [Gammaproteobacteria bacterium]
MYTRLCSSVLFPLHELYKGHASTQLRAELERSQWLKPTELLRLQAQRLQQFLVEAGKNVPYYREVFASQGFNPERVESVAHLAALPFLTKSLVRENVEALKSKTAGPLRRYNTGGSSGEPLVFYMGRGRISHDVAAKWRATRWWNVDIGDAEIVLWGSPVELGSQDRIKNLRDRVFRSHLLPAFEMSDARMDEFLASIRRIRPRMMFGYASALAMLVTHAQARGVVLNDLGVRVVFTTGETLYPDQRKIIEAAFGAPAANGYGARDAGFIAHQCPAGSLHLSTEHIVVELVNADGVAVAPGEEGEIVVTHLATGDFPFIRYRTGDVAVQSLEPCSCGRGLPVLKSVLGRSTDFIRTRSGNAMHALALIYEVRDDPGVRAFKYIQAEDLSIELQIVAGPELTLAKEQEIFAKLTRRLGADTPLKIVRVERIAAEKSGKYRYVVSKATAAPARSLSD